MRCVVRSDWLRSETGNGLGLFVCNRLLMRLGGKLELKESTINGSTFTIKVPYEMKKEYIK